MDNVSNWIYVYPSVLHCIPSKCSDSTGLGGTDTISEINDHAYESLLNLGSDSLSGICIYSSLMSGTGSTMSCIHSLGISYTEQFINHIYIHIYCYNCYVYSWAQYSIWTSVYLITRASTGVYHITRESAGLVEYNLHHKIAIGRARLNPVLVILPLTLWQTIP